MSWIKVEGSTPNKPEVLKLARLLGVTRDDAFGKAMRFWIWLDGVTVDGVVDGVVDGDVDAIVGAVGFAEALASVGWLAFGEDGQSITVPNFTLHNGASAKARAVKTKRQAKWRAGNVDDIAPTEAPTGPSTDASTRLDKSIILFPIPKSLNTEPLVLTWVKWLQHLQHRRGQLPSKETQEQMLMDLARRGADKAIRDIEYSLLKQALNILDGSPKADKPNGSGKEQQDGNRVASLAEMRKAYGVSTDEP